MPWAAVCCGAHPDADPALARGGDAVVHRAVHHISYSEIDRFVSGAGSNVLSDRLRRLIAAGIVSRRAPPEPGSPAVYQLTDRGLALAPVLAQLSDWGLRLLVPEDPASLPTEGRVFDQVWATRSNEDRLPKEVYQWFVDERPFYFEVQGFAIRQFPGVADTPTVTLRMSWDALEQGIRGELDWEQATASGHVKIDGPADAARRMLQVTGMS